MTPTRVLIADDSHLFGDALELILEADERIEVVGRALETAAAFPAPNEAARAAAAAHDVRLQAERVEEVLLRASRGRRA